MKFTATLGALAAILPAALAQTTYGLRAIPDANQPALSSPYTEVAYYGSSLYIGDIKYQTAAEKFILEKLTKIVGKYTDAESGISFTSFHSSPTGWQNLYIFPTTNLGSDFRGNDSTKPVGFTVPHSGSVPTGATTTGFTLGATDRLLRYKDTNGWYACPVAGNDRWYQIIYVGGSDSAPAACTAVTLKAEPYGTCA
ncbi:hypothetical protein BDZ91DRAFT_767358 [Kalaharituber pfeilii]|nr:hypothetical protein BDZ91DRAFT_767358 [Kalaharituber pfeilii]